MRGDFPEDRPKDIWLNQPTETPTMTLKLIQQRSRDLRSTTRRKLFGALVGPVATAILYVFGMKEFTALRQTLQPLFAAAFAWSLAGLYFLNRGMWSAVMPADAGLITGLEFCRREIERQRDLVRRSLVWSFAPIMLAMGAFILALAMVSTKAKGLFPNGLPFLIAIAVWIFAYFIIRLREQRELQRGIDDLNDMEKENHARGDHKQ
jgi:hypothetical protein